MNLGSLLGSGRDADVYALDEHRVVRRARLTPDVAPEAAAMRHAGAHGYPAPTVFSAEGRDLVMERLDGPTLLEALAAGDVGPGETGAMLWRLLADLHALPPRDGARPGQRLVHLDLHPDNVMLTASGPVVIDWTNARDDDPALDVALSALILAQVAVDAESPFADAARAVLDGLLGAGADPGPGLDRAAALRGANPTMSARELHQLPAAVALLRGR